MAVEHNQLEASNPLTPPDEHNSFENIQSESANQLEASTQIIDQSEPETNDHNYFEMLEDSEEPVIISFKKLDEENLKVLLDKTVDNTCGICKKQFKGGLSSYPHLELQISIYIFGVGIYICVCLFVCL